MPPIPDGGAAASPARLADAIARFGPVVRLVYGSSEAPLIADLPFLAHDPGHPERLRSCGRPFADTRIEIRDESRITLPAGETGEVWVTGSLLMSSYWNSLSFDKKALRQQYQALQGTGAG
jgi:fatty-acyl-CoA synthase